MFTISAIIGAIILMLPKNVLGNTKNILSGANKKGVAMISGGSTALWESFFGFLQGLEGYHEKPYWDYKQWSWGYGTRVPNTGSDKNVVPKVTTTKENAFAEMRKYCLNDYEKLRSIILVPISNNQMSALLSFSYNLGFGSASKMVSLINANQLDQLRKSWASYNKVRVKQVLIFKQGLQDRRNNELTLFFK